jgi:hypothetical protein
MFDGFNRDPIPFRSSLSALAVEFNNAKPLHIQGIPESQT